MSENSTFSSVPTGRECTAAPIKFLSFIEGVPMTIGINIGAGVLSIAYASSKTGFLPLLFWLVLVGSLTTVTTLYVMEPTLRTRKHLRLSGLSKRYVDGFGAPMIFLSVCVNSVGALAVYMTGSGKLLHLLFGISSALGSVLFFVPAAGVLYLDLKVVDRGEKFTNIGMMVMISVLVTTTLLKETIHVGYLFDSSWLHMVLVFSVVAFCFLAQYIVPEMVRGFAGKPKKLPRAIVAGMVLIFALLALVPLLVIPLNGLDNISDVATISWGRAPDEQVFFSANLLVLCAMLTSYWGLGGSFLTNIFDQFRLGNDEQPARCLMVLLVMAIPLFVLAYSGVVSSVSTPYLVRASSGVILSITPILMLEGACQRGDLTPGQTCPARMTYPFIRCFIVLLYLCSAVYAIAPAVGYLLADW